MAFQSGSGSLQWYDSSSLLCSSPVPLVVPLSAPHHCLHLSFLPNSFSWLCLVVHTEPDCSTFPELIGVTLAWQETQCHYGNLESITRQRINTLSVIFDSHICVGLMVAMHGCYLLRGILSSSPAGTRQCAQGHLCYCWIVRLPWLRAFHLHMKNLNVNFTCHLKGKVDCLISASHCILIIFPIWHHLQDIWPQNDRCNNLFLVTGWKLENMTCLLVNLLIFHHLIEH